jgi:hypothetical protein
MRNVWMWKELYIFTASVSTSTGGMSQLPREQLYAVCAPRLIPIILVFSSFNAICFPSTRRLTKVDVHVVTTKSDRFPCGFECHWILNIIGNGFRPSALSEGTSNILNFAIFMDRNGRRKFVWISWSHFVFATSALPTARVAYYYTLHYSSLASGPSTFVATKASLSLHAQQNVSSSTYVQPICLSVFRPPIYLSIYLWLYSSLLYLSRLFSLLILYTLDRTPWTGISLSEGRYLHTEQHKYRINAHRHPCFVWDSNPRSQRSSERRQFIPQTARPLWLTPTDVWRMK